MNGCGMRSSVGFLSRRELTGEPFIKEEFQRRRLAGCTSLYKKDMLGHFGCVNAIEFSNNGGEWLVSGGDDRRVLLWHMEKAIHGRSKPVKLKGEHRSNIFCLAFDSSNAKVFSGGNDEQVILHDVERGETLNVFLHIDAVYSLSVNPVNDNVFASSSDDGRVLIWDTRGPPNAEPFCLAIYPSAFHSVMFNPVEPRLIATANSKEGVGLWDIRKPRSSLLRYGGSMSLQSAMSVRFNSARTHLHLAASPPAGPVHPVWVGRLQPLHVENPQRPGSRGPRARGQRRLHGAEGSSLHREPGPLQPPQLHDLLLGRGEGHQGQWASRCLCSRRWDWAGCGGTQRVLVCLRQLWSPYRQPGSLGDLEGLVEEKSRSLYTHEEYISLVLNSGSGLSHDYVSQSVQEDPRMMAFFDSLVRREIEGWSSDSDSDLSEAIMQLHARGRRAARGGAAPAAATPGSAQQSDSDDSSSSSLAGADVSAGEEGAEPRRQGRRRRRGSGFLDNEDSDSRPASDPSRSRRCSRRRTPAATRPYRWTTCPRRPRTRSETLSRSNPAEARTRRVSARPSLNVPREAAEAGRGGRDRTGQGRGEGPRSGTARTAARRAAARRPRRATPRPGAAAGPTGSTGLRAGTCPPPPTPRGRRPSRWGTPGRRGTKAWLRNGLAWPRRRRSPTQRRS
ncbi:unnamed protein product [Tetraodon nigroviridis]|uniref:(spotted green pufferfish) hypothetical protein n=1 Tax=Tetraodon nigroviridis TaxID=99883 RepID=Q4STW6_TETNG|nr:unnamed protein product [Tetraodon nigroviridis]